jgi:hypothetical protein
VQSIASIPSVIATMLIAEITPAQAASWVSARPRHRKTQMKSVWGALKNYSGSILLAVGVVALLTALGYGFKELATVATSKMMVTSLRLLAIGGVTVLIMLLTVVAMIFSLLGLTDKGLALGLPEGSIRGGIALSLIMLFAILVLFLYQGVSTTGVPVNTVVNLSEVDRAQFFKDHSTARGIEVVSVKDENGQPLVARGQDGRPLKNADGTPQYRYNVSYRSSNPTNDAFTKQLLVLLGTLMTAITNFYLGAGTATSAAAAAAQTPDLAIPPPTVTSINPTGHSIANDGPVIHPHVLGNNLNIITQVRLVRAGGEQVIGTNFASNPIRVTCDIAVSAVPPGGLPWDVVIDDGASMLATLPGALTING